MLFLLFPAKNKSRFFFYFFVSLFDFSCLSLLLALVFFPHLFLIASCLVFFRLPTSLMSVCLYPSLRLCHIPSLPSSSSPHAPISSVCPWSLLLFTFILFSSPLTCFLSVQILVSNYSYLCLCGPSFFFLSATGHLPVHDWHSTSKFTYLFVLLQLFLFLSCQASSSIHLCVICHSSINPNLAYII